MGIWDFRVCQWAGPAGHSTPRTVDSAHGEPNPGSDGRSLECPISESQNFARLEVIVLSDLPVSGRFKLFGPRRAGRNLGATSLGHGESLKQTRNPRPRPRRAGPRSFSIPGPSSSLSLPVSPSPAELGNGYSA